MKNSTFLSLSLIFAVVAVGFGYWYTTSYAPAQKTEKTLLVTASPATTEAQYPINDEDKDAPAAAAAATQTPAAIQKPMAVSFKPGEALEDRLARFFDPDKFNSLIITKDLAHQFVVFIENISERKPSGVFSLFAPLSNEFQITSTDDDVVMNPKNFGRYKPYIELLDSVDSDTLVRIYKHYYKNFQSAFDELGMGGYFNDRLVSAIDVVLAAPNVSDTIVLKGNGPYVFVNPEYESLPAGQKVLIRMGPDNANVLRSKIRQLRQLVARRR